MFQQPFIQAINNSEYRLAKPYVYETEDNGKLIKLTIHEGFITDGASVPTAFWSLGLKPTGLYTAAAVVHDYLYLYRGRVDKNAYAELEGNVWVPKERDFTRKECDRIFLDLMKKAGVGRFRRTLMYRSVRMFGWGPW